MMRRWVGKWLVGKYGVNSNAFRGKLSEGRVLEGAGGCMLQSEGMQLLRDETSERSSEGACIVSICVGITWECLGVLGSHGVFPDPFRPFGFCQDALPDPT